MELIRTAADLVGKDEVRKYFGLKANRTIELWIRDRGLPVIKIGHRVFFKMAAVEEWAQQYNSPG